MVQKRMPDLDLAADLGDLLDDWIGLLAMWAFKVLAGLFENLLKEGRSSDVVMLYLLHLLRIGLEVGFLKQHFKAVLAHHL